MAWTAIMCEIRRSGALMRLGILARQSGWRAQLFRFLAVGVLNTLFGQAVFVGLVLLGVHDQLALLIATVIGVLFNFQTIGRLVFRDKSKKLLVRFVLCYIVSYSVNALALNALTSAGLSPIVAQAILIVPIALLTFLINRIYVFRPAISSDTNPENS